MYLGTKPWSTAELSSAALLRGCDPRRFGARCCPCGAPANLANAEAIGGHWFAGLATTQSFLGTAPWSRSLVEYMATAAARSAERYLLALPGGPPRAGRVGLRVTVIRICRI